jgi:hypothetical protein
MTRAAGGKKFSKLDVKRVYFGESWIFTLLILCANHATGNWLRDYSQAVDVCIHHLESFGHTLILV